MSRREIIARTSAAKTKLEGSGLASAQAGAPASFKITAHDEDGTAQVLGGDLFRCRLVTEDGVSVNATIIDVGDGTYAASYTPIVSGIYKLAEP